MHGSCGSSVDDSALQSCGPRELKRSADSSLLTAFARAPLASSPGRQNLDMAMWSGFRPADADHTRSLDEVAPEEIANAMRSAIALAPMGDRDDILRSTAEIFGIARLGANVRARLDAVYAQIPRS